MEPTRLVLTLSPVSTGEVWLHWEYLGIFSDHAVAAGGHQVPADQYPFDAVVARYHDWQEHESRSPRLPLDT